MKKKALKCLIHVSYMIKKGIKLNKKESHRLVFIEGDLYFINARTSLEKAIELMMQEMRSWNNV